MLKKILTYLNNLGNLEKIGTVFVSAAVFLVAFIFYPVIKQEIRYTISAKNNSAPVETREQAALPENNNSTSDIIVPVDENFGIVIPKISANAKVIPEVDSQDSDIYQRALTQGVAHAKGTALPGENGNTFIFAHSSADFLEASRYNAVFYLLSKLEYKDKIYLFYEGRKYVYEVKEQKKVEATDVSFLEKNTPESRLTLMTCWPPGTTLKRLIIIAQPVL